MAHDVGHGCGLHGVGRFAAPQLHDDGLGRFHGAVEVVVVHTVNVADFAVDELFALLHALQRSDVLLGEGAQRVEVEVTREEEVEVAAGGKAFAVEALHHFVVSLFQVGQLQGACQRVVAKDGAGDGVAERAHGVFRLVFERCAQRSHRVLVGIGVVHRSLEAQVDEFEERAQVLGS